MSSPAPQANPPLSTEDVEKIVLDANNPERLYLDGDDWEVIHKTYGTYSADHMGVYIQVLGTRIYGSRPVSVNYCNSRVIKDVIADKASKASIPVEDK